MERKCCLCSEGLTACFGYVVAGDFIDYISGKRQDVREVCGRDVLRLDLISERAGRNISEVIREHIY